MSDRTWQERFLDIIQAADRVTEYISDINENDFNRDSKTVDAVVRNIILIGDAATGVESAVREELPDIPWRTIVGMRNILTHEYFQVDVAKVWRTATHDMLPLASRLTAYLQSTQTP